MSLTLFKGNAETIVATFNSKSLSKWDKIMNKANVMDIAVKPATTIY